MRVPKVSSETIQKIFICSSVIVMITAFFASKFRKRKRSENTENDSKSSSLPKNAVKLKQKNALVKEKSVKTKLATFLSDNDNFFGKTELEENSGCSTPAIKKRLNFKKKVFMSDCEGKNEESKCTGNKFETEDFKMNEFYFAVFEKLKH